MQTVTALVPRSADACWQLFIDVGQLASWVPGLRSAQILTLERGLPAEIHFELESYAYTLVYSYDRVAREVRWQPKIGKHEGVTGFVKFEAEDDHTRVTYGIEPGRLRTTEEDLQRLVDAFARRVQR